MQNRRAAYAALIAVLVTVGVLYFTNLAVTPKQATWDDVLAEAKSGGYGIVTTWELFDLRRDDSGTDSKNPIIVDTRQEWEYRTGHLKGAVNFPIEPTWWSRWRKAPALEALLGPEKERIVVFY